MTRRLLLAAAVLLVLARLGAAGDRHAAIDAGDLFVATITRVEDKGATNARPPRVWLTVHEVLKGDKDAKHSPAVWDGPWHGIDWGDENTPELIAWKKAPLKGPRVGDKFILGGWVVVVDVGGMKTEQYHILDFIHIPYSDAAREKTLAQLATLEMARLKYAAEQAAAAKAHAERRAAWRASVDEKTIDRRTQQADAVAIGTITGGSGYLIERMLKGRARMSTGGEYYLTIATEDYDPRIVDFVYDRPRCVLFLSEENLTASVGVVRAKLVDPYDGIVLADDAAIAAVEASLKKHPPPAPRPLVVISALDRDDGPPVAKAVRGSFDVLQTLDFTGHSPLTIKHVRESFSDAACMVTIERGDKARVQAIRIHEKDADVFYEAAWPDRAGQREFDALLTAIAEQFAN
jgi:hypothetical protein